MKFGFRKIDYARIIDAIFEDEERSVRNELESYFYHKNSKHKEQCQNYDMAILKDTFQKY